MGWAGQLPIENTLSLLVVPRVTNIHLSPAALMNEVTRHNKGFLWVLSSLSPFFVWTDIDKMIKRHTLLVAIVLNTALRASLKKGGGGADAVCYCQQLCKTSALRPLFMCFFYRHYIPALWLAFYPMQIILMDKEIVWLHYIYATIGNYRFRQPPAPLFSLFVRYYYVTVANIRACW